MDSKAFSDDQRHNLDVTKGTIMVETPPLSLGVIDGTAVDGRQVTAVRAEYLLVPPGYAADIQRMW